MLLQRPIRKSMLKNFQEDDTKRKESPSIFLRFNLFRNFALQSEIDATNSNYQIKFPYNELLSQKILCYRKSSENLSLIEKIMREPGSGAFIAFVWRECDFWRDSSSLTTVNKFMQNFHVLTDDFPTTGQRTGETVNGLSD